MKWIAGLSENALLRWEQLGDPEQGQSIENYLKRFRGTVPRSFVPSKTARRPARREVWGGPEKALAVGFNVAFWAKGGQGMTLLKNVSPPDPRRLDDPKHWRDKAEEARRKAEDMTDSEARETMMRVAEQYDRLAEKAEHRSPEPRP